MPNASDQGGLPILTVDLVRYLDEHQQSSVTVEWLESKMGIEDRRLILKSRYERALAKLNEE